MVILLRILLVLLPIVLLVVWLRWRSKVNRGGDIPEAEVKSLRQTLIVLLITLFGVGVGLKLTGSNDIDGIYVPARVVDGKLIPGYFKPNEAAGETTDEGHADQKNDAADDHKKD